MEVDLQILVHKQIPKAGHGSYPLRKALWNNSLLAKLKDYLAIVVRQWYPNRSQNVTTG